MKYLIIADDWVLRKLTLRWSLVLRVFVEEGPQDQYLWRQGRENGGQREKPCFSPALPELMNGFKN